MERLLNLFSTIPCDKLGHIVAGLSLYAVGHFVSTMFGFVVVLCAAIGKEVYDYWHRDTHTPDIWDAVATVLGGTIGLICGL